MQLLRIKYLITEKNFSQNNCESNVLNIYITCSLGSKELILKRASSESKIVEKTLRAGCELEAPTVQSRLFFFSMIMG